MRIDFEFSGGFGGLFAQKPLAYHADTEQLPNEVRDKLLELIATSGVADLTTKPHPTKGADAAKYKLSITEQGTTIALSLDDISAPRSVRPLLQYLQELAVAERAR